jgi:hypothetical protein
MQIGAKELTIPGVTCHLETITRASDDLPAEAGRVRILSYFMPEPAPGRRRLLNGKTGP